MIRFLARNTTRQEIALKMILDTVTRIENYLKTGKVSDYIVQMYLRVIR